MTKSTVPAADTAAIAVREVQPFAFLEPARLPLRNAPRDEGGQRWLAEHVLPELPMLVRMLVDYTIERQNKRALERGNPQPIAMSVLNRRRRIARTWLLAILDGKVDAATWHAVATQWLPVLCGTGPDLAAVARPGRVLIEFVRGALTASVFDEAQPNLLPHARALHVLESTLAVHLSALQQIARLSS